ncbi:uncharacterized protein PITG_15693 [Phytophthora infestans T30-4]|uniref:Uncharacterized protein n=1 Tax=Phytophthora infestans (strain T30-4) TaxID=403677 RepID=D0NSC4_PHYIT|nr:uncharacterized protein PITG_15693 [Phytophthora infestans T30-4]EEY64469.1 hypothetical protein PITG_15693 [Phytophthora infestans T30-4]|eukprot:XP_002897972.1 hypothetical protein PITG_15693 [Phytophthora infestans T30-4]
MAAFPAALPGVCGFSSLPWAAECFDRFFAQFGHIGSSNARLERSTIYAIR